MSGYDTQEQWMARRYGGQELDLPEDHEVFPDNDDVYLNLYQLDFGDETVVNQFRVVRIPGGWIYYNDSQGLALFVPYEPMITVTNCTLDQLNDV